MVNRDLFHYLGLLIKKSFTGIFLVGDLIGTLLLALSLNQPKVPPFISIGAFVLIVLLSTFSVWRDERQENTKLRSKLDKIKDGIPRYEVSVGAIKTYTLKTRIIEVENELKETKRLIEERQSIVQAGTNALSSAIKQLTDTLAKTPGLLGHESTEAKADRLEDYLETLIDYQKMIEHVYFVPLAISSTRADSNIEIEVVIDEDAEFMLEDDYPEQHLPQSSSSPYSDLVLMPRMQSSRDSLYGRGYSSKHKAFSMLTNINADRDCRLFEDDLFVLSKKSKHELNITIRSQKLNNKQQIRLPLNLLSDSITEIGLNDVAE